MTTKTKTPLDRVSLKDVVVNHVLSEETLAFSATVVLDGQEIGTVKNQGTGGNNLYTIPREDYKKLDKVARQWAEMHGEDDPFEPVDVLVSRLILLDEAEQEAAKNARKGYPVTLLCWRGWHPFENGEKPGPFSLGRWEDTFITSLKTVDQIERYIEENEIDRHKVIRSGGS